jgi:hypothetical protein
MVATKLVCFLLLELSVLKKQVLPDDVAGGFSLSFFTGRMHHHLLPPSNTTAMLIGSSFRKLQNSVIFPIVDGYSNEKATFHRQPVKVIT